MTHDWIGLREADLDDRERALAAEEGVHRDEHLAALALGRSLATVTAATAPPPPSMERALARVRADRAPPRRWVWAAPAALAAATLLAVVGLPESARNKGAAAPPAVHLEAAAEGPAGVRPLSDGAAVGPDERVIFRAEAGGEGWLSITDESGGALLSARGAGRHVVGGDAPRSYRPDGAAAEGTYRAVLCRDGPPDATLRADCGVSELTLRWE